MWAIISLIGKFIKPLSGIFTTKMNVDLEKYKVDGHLDEALVTAAVQELQVQASSQDTTIGGRAMRYLFVYPLGIWWTGVIVDSVCRGFFHWDWRVLALPTPLDTWAGWIIAYLFLHSSVISLLRR